MTYFREMFSRLSRARVFVAVQVLGMLSLILLGVAWTRIPDKLGWQVALTLLVPFLLVAATLALQAATMRRMVADEPKIRFAWGALSLVVWIALGWVTWALLDWADDHLYEWAGYLNSKASAHTRGTIFTYNHLYRWFTIAEWVVRWIIAPGKLIPYALASVSCGWRLPVRRILRVMLSWRWWPAVALAALASVALPARFFSVEPHGTVSQQIWAVSLKLIATYGIAICCWILLLAWGAALYRLSGPARPDADNDSGELVPKPALVGSPDSGKSAAVRLPLPDSNDDIARNA